MQAHEQAHALKKVQEHLNSIKLDAERRVAWAKRIEELSETVPPTYTVCVVGGSGTGKSTLLCALVGKEVMPTSASVSLDSLCTLL